MFDELVKRFRDAAKVSDALAVLLPHSEGNATAKLYNEAADAIEELSRKTRQLPRWIPVTERLPQESDRYIVIAVEPWFGTVCTEIMKYRVNENLWVYDGRITEATVTHWMPLPQPPKEET